jgi:hypothetical protein
VQEKTCGAASEIHSFELHMEHGIPCLSSSKLAISPWFDLSRMNVKNNVNDMIWIWVELVIKLQNAHAHRQAIIGSQDCPDLDAMILQETASSCEYKYTNADCNLCQSIFETLMSAVKTMPIFDKQFPELCPGEKKLRDLILNRQLF